MTAVAAGSAAQAAHRRELTAAAREAAKRGGAHAGRMARARKIADARELERVRGEQARLKAEAAARRAASEGV